VETQETIATRNAAPLKPRLTRNQVRSFWAAWGGWSMDGMDSFIYSLVLVPALTELLPRSGIAATTANIGFYGGLFFALFMIGYGTALIWGADRGPLRARADDDAQHFLFFVIHAAGGVCHGGVEPRRFPVSCRRRNWRRMGGGRGAGVRGLA